LPLTIYYFNNFSFLAILANLIAIPLSFLIIILAIIFVVFGAGLAANFFASLTSLAIGFLLKFLALLSAVPFGFYRASAWPVGIIVCFYIFMIFIFNYRRLKVKLFYMASAALLIFAFVSWAGVFKEQSSVMKVNFFDVGFGDAILIEFPEGQCMLVDGGPAKGDCGRRIIAPYLWNKNIKRIDAVVLTHPESDHLGGLNFILENFEIGAVFDSGRKSESLSFARYINILSREKIPRFTLCQAHAICGFKDTEILALNPPAIAFTGTKQNLNNNSVVLEINYKDFGLLLTGDIQAEALRSILTYKDRLKPDIVKLPHHGLESGVEFEALLKTLNENLQYR